MFGNVLNPSQHLVLVFTREVPAIPRMLNLGFQVSLAIPKNHLNTRKTLFSQMQGCKVMQIYVGMFFLNDLLEID